MLEQPSRANEVDDEDNNVEVMEVDVGTRIVGSAGQGQNNLKHCGNKVVVSEAGSVHQHNVNNTELF